MDPNLQWMWVKGYNSVSFYPPRDFKLLTYIGKLTQSVVAHIVMCMFFGGYENN